MVFPHVGGAPNRCRFISIHKVGMRVWFVNRNFVECTIYEMESMGEDGTFLLRLSFLFVNVVFVIIIFVIGERQYVGVNGRDDVGQATNTKGT